MNKIEVGKKYKNRYLDSLFTKIISIDLSRQYPVIGEVYYRHREKETATFKLDGRYNIEKISRYDLVALFDGENLEVCAHQWEEVVLFSHIEKFCKICNTKKINKI